MSRASRAIQDSQFHFTDEGGIFNEVKKRGFVFLEFPFKRVGVEKPSTRKKKRTETTKKDPTGEQDEQQKRTREAKSFKKKRRASKMHSQLCGKPFG